MVHSQSVGTLVFSGAGHGGSTQVYIITQNSKWDQINSSNKYLSPFQNPNPNFDYHGYGVVEQEDKIYLVGGDSGRYQNIIQVINFQSVDKVQIARTRRWIFIENLKNAVYKPAVIYREKLLLIVGNGFSTTCQDVHYLNLSSNITGVYASTVDCGEFDDRHYMYNAGIYDIVGGDVSIFGGHGADRSCIQQTVSDDNIGVHWKCVPSSKSAFEGLGYHQSWCGIFGCVVKLWYYHIVVLNFEICTT